MNLFDALRESATLGPQVQRFDWDADGNIIYMGLAPFGSSDDDYAWVIARYSYGSFFGEIKVARIEYNLAKNRWVDRANAAILGWQ